MAGDKKTFSKCSLDENGCLQLSSVLKAFGNSISEEQAWAVCFQTAKCCIYEWNSDSNSCYTLSDMSHVYMHKDGYIHKSTIKLKTVTGSRKLASNEKQLVYSLGEVVFRALDYMLPPDEERCLSPELEYLIEWMTGGPMESDQMTDEGIEQDSEEDENAKHRRTISLTHVMQLCAKHLPCPEQADCHYKAVCRALVAEVLELTTFLENISKTNNLRNCVVDEVDRLTLEKLQLEDWARLWMQVIQQLRQGVKLKKVEAAHSHSIEYALTPYEMLLDDIRSRRYKLRQVMVNGDIPPRVKKDAHAMILDFIRSRPPLVPVSRRKMPPTPPRSLNVYEKLMASIKQRHTLKPTLTTPENSPKRKIEPTSKPQPDESPQPQRRLIKADLTLQLTLSQEDFDDTTPLEDDFERNPLFRTNSHADSSFNGESNTTPTEDKTPLGILYRHSNRTAKSDYWKSSHWQSLECLSLTLEEVVHIRTVLTKFELESHLVDPPLHQDLQKGKVCFTCKQVRFSFFGQWGVKCKMCEKTVCDTCSTKMRIPTEHFARIPVYMLSPTPSPPPEEEQSSSQRFWQVAFDKYRKSEIKENIPQLNRQKTISSLPHSESIQSMAAKRRSLPPAGRAPLNRSKTLVTPNQSHKSETEELMKGPLVAVCRDCKVLVCNLIQGSQDKICFDQPTLFRTWPQKRKSSGTPKGRMDTLSETPTDEVFRCTTP